MNKIAIYLVFVMLCIGCQKADIDVDNIPSTDSPYSGEPINSITLGVDDRTDTRVGVNVEPGVKDIYFWKTDDKIIFVEMVGKDCTGNNYEYTYLEAADNGKAIFVGSGVKLDGNYKVIHTRSLGCLKLPESLRGQLQYIVPSYVQKLTISASGQMSSGLMQDYADCMLFATQTINGSDIAKGNVNLESQLAKVEVVLTATKPADEGKPIHTVSLEPTVQNAYASVIDFNENEDQNKTVYGTPKTIVTDKSAVLSTTKEYRVRILVAQNQAVASGAKVKVASGLQEYIASTTTSSVILPPNRVTRLVRKVDYFKDVEPESVALPYSYAGAFWRAAQKGERVIRIPVSGDGSGNWSARVVWKDAHWGADDIVLGGTTNSDGTSNFSNPYTTSLTTADPESAAWITTANSDYISDNVDAAQGGDFSSFTKNNFIYFKIGLKSEFTAYDKDTNPARYAIIALTHTNNTKIQYIYLRQGEGADYVMTGTNAVKWSVYNLGTTANPGTTPATPMSFPTQAGYFYQWGYSKTENIPRPYNPVGTSLSPTWSNSYNSALYSLGSLSPTGYTLPTIDNFKNLSTAKFIRGYYADGYFDRGQVKSSTSSPGYSNTAVNPSSSDVAYIGRLYFNPISKASIFLPIAGTRVNSNGQLINSGLTGNYWSCSADLDPNKAYHLNFKDDVTNWASYYRTGGFPIRCVK